MTDTHEPTDAEVEAAARVVHDTFAAYGVHDAGVGAIEHIARAALRAALAAAARVRPADEATDEPCTRACQYALDVGMGMYASVANGKCTEHEAYLRHLVEMDDRADQPADDRDADKVWPDDYGWGDLMTLLDRHWPGDIFGDTDRPVDSLRGDRVGDAGVRIVALLRWVDLLTAERDEALAEIERLTALLRCDAEHPDDADELCGLDKGHGGEHVSTGGRTWPSDVYLALKQRDEARRVIADVRALADQHADWCCSKGCTGPGMCLSQITTVSALVGKCDESCNCESAPYLAVLDAAAAHEPGGDAAGTEGSA